MELAVLAAMVVVVGILVYLVIRLGRTDFTHLAHRMARRTRQSFEVLKPCPLCSTMLRRGQTVRSVVFSGERGPATEEDRAERAADTIAHLYGCPYCYPANNEHPRICPVCRRAVEPDGYVYARMFRRPGRRHVHVLGCTGCRQGRKK